MYAKVVTAFLKHLAPEGELALDFEDEITRGALLTRDGNIANDAVRALAEGASSSGGAG
jgi:NAD(P) transhydrogenase subunit alpha